MTRIAGVEAINEAVALLKAKKPVAFPTETVYGLAGNALDAQACHAVFAAKGRPLDNPLIVHISDLHMLSAIVDCDRISPAARLLAEKFWPGPLTLVLPRKVGAVPDVVVGGSAPDAAYRATVAVRMPNHPLTLQLIRTCGFPLVGPSANTSGRPSPTCASHVLQDLSGKIDLILDGGPCSIGVESTVVDTTCDPAVILRPGGLCLEELEPYLPGLKVYRRDYFSAQLEANPTTPGMKYRHYSPEAQLVLVSGVDAAEKRQKTLDWMQEALKAGSTVGYLKGLSSVADAADEDLSWLLSQHPTCKVIDLGSEVAAIATNLFASLRRMDEMGVDFIIVDPVPEDRQGLAIMNRLEKAASQII